MKTVGLLGGMSWESTVSYYKAINEGIKEKLGGLHSAQIAMVSVDFQPIETLQHQGDWQGTADILCAAAQQVEKAGADFLLICTNTMHKVYSEIANAINIPIIHIADSTADVIKAKGFQTVALLGTRFTMEQSFYKDRLTEQNIQVITPKELDRKIIHNVIYNELCLGEIKEKSKQQYLTIMDKLVDQGAEAIILGCTEISLLVQQDQTSIPLLDTTKIHANDAVIKMLL